MSDDFLINCCFCGEDIETFCNAVAMTITLHKGGSQELWAHVTCLREHLHDSAHLSVFEPLEASPAALTDSFEA